MIKPKTAIIEIECPVDDFFCEWEESGENVEPTQLDYDKWALSTSMGFLQNHKYELDNYLKLVENSQSETNTPIVPDETMEMLKRCGIKK
jgi:hypothetical protein